MNKIRTHLLYKDPYVEKEHIFHNHDGGYYICNHIGSGVSSYYNNPSETIDRVTNIVRQLGNTRIGEMEEIYD